VAADKIFICYRRDDSAGHAGRLYDRLNQKFPGRVFMDVAKISAGTRWAEVIEKTLRSCGVIIILIGKRWLERGASGERRIDQTGDSTRAEITTALRLNTRVVPLLVSGAAMPDAKDLPDDVAPIADWQALRIDDDDFDHDSTRLIRALEGELAEATRDPASSSSHLRVVAPPPLPQPAPPHHSPQPAVQQPRPRKGSGLWVGFGAGALAILVLGAILAYREPIEPIHPTPAPDPINPGPAPVDPGPDRPSPRPVETKTVEQPSLAGNYALTSFIQQGSALPVTGSMQLVPIRDGVFQFHTIASNSLTGATFEYRGLFQWTGTFWTVTTTQTNDPTVGSAPVAHQVQFDGTTLALQNHFGQTLVWRKQIARE
jgi:hypothetical protein